MFKLRQWAWVGALMIGCAGSKAEAPPNLTTPEAVANAPQGSTEVAPLEPVEAPPELVLVGHARELTSLVETLSTWANVPVSLPELVAAELPQLKDALQWDAGVQVAMALDPEGGQMSSPLAVVSLGLRDHQQALQALKASGAAVERFSSQLSYVQLEEDLNCAIARANGPAPARLVCGSDRKAIDALAPYAATTLAAAPAPPDDLWLRVDIEPLRAKYGKMARMLKLGVPTFLSEVSIGNARFDAAMADAAHATVDEVLTLIDELDALTWRASLDEAGQALDTSLQVAFRGSEGFVSRSLQVTSEQQKPPPEMFWRLPHDSQSATFAVGTEPTPRYESAVDTVGELLAGGLEHVGLASGPLTAWVAELKQLLRSTGPSVATSGPAEARAEQTGGTLVDAFGYTILGFEDKGALARLINATITVWNDTRLRYELKNRGFDDALSVPKIRTRSAPVAAKLPPATRVHEIEFDRGAVRQFELDEVAGEAGFKATALVLIDGDTTWAVFALDEALAIRKLQQLLGDAAGEQLRGRSDIEFLRQLKSTWWASLLTLDGFLRETGAVMDDPQWSANLLRGLPHQGRVPMFIHAQAESTPALNLHFRVPRAVIEDASVAAVSLAAESRPWR